MAQGREIKFGTIIETTDGQLRVVIDVIQAGDKIGFETLGIISLIPLWVTYGNGSSDPNYLKSVHDTILTIDQVLDGVLAYNGWLSTEYKQELEKLERAKRVVIV